MEDRWKFVEGEEIRPGLHALAPLGSSSRYETWLAYDERLMSIVVAKLVRPHRVDDAHVVNDLALEAETLSRLAHPIVLRAFDSVPEGPRPHIVLEHLEGPTLRALIKRYGALALDQVLPLALHVCSALHYLESEDVVHLDVKPENIVMSAPPRLIDFSIARRRDEARALTDVIGTYAYMAPEQAFPEEFGDIGSPADVWGLGMALYEATTGRAPFGPIERNPNPKELPQLWHEPAYIEPPVPPAMIEIILDCLEKDPRARPTPREVALRLEPMIADLPRLPILRRARVSVLS